MKKVIILCLIFLCLLFNNSVNAINPPPSNVYTEGIYKVSDLNISTGNLYTVQNLSNDNVLVQVYDENKEVLQYMRLPPSSRKISLLQLKPDYRIVILGKGDIFISPG
ncbi:hypothetical protein NNC19_18505 [Clostridium sp. SHJSY1]|uniref:hypothetical protein n=1 Tax=Clostridium sp. SHJSY1 TaxID=2942483 RepID=UPI002876F64A|nr:hypothetical protein [Clostridium sp. SHJSY1]MDS0527685.1 hypothetical protein [Clostridium sp. SHJSY1]